MAGDCYDTADAKVAADGRRQDMRGRRWVGVGAMWLALAVTAHAQDTATFPAGGIAEALKARVGKPVMLHLASGTQLGGTVAEVRDHAVVVKGITGRELSDALVRLDQIAAVEVRARER
jgi:hypothetical protein